MGLLTLKEAQERVSKSFLQKVEVLDYNGRRHPAKLHCLECGNIWYANGDKVANTNHTHQCPKCQEKNSGTIEVECSYCGKKIKRRKCEQEKNKSGYFYCSITCGNNHKNQLRKQNGEWENSKNYRYKAFQDYEHKCCVCGYDEDERILEVHHIDENREHNNIDNLCILCPTCHRKITLGYYRLTKDFCLEKK